MNLKYIKLSLNAHFFKIAEVNYIQRYKGNIRIVNHISNPCQISIRLFIMTYCCKKRVFPDPYVRLSVKEGFLILPANFKQKGEMIIIITSRSVKFD